MFRKSLDKVPVVNGIYQLTDMPDAVTSGDGDKYIGYEHVGEAYSGKNKYVIDEEDVKTAEYIANIAGDGVLLDLGCADGRITVPCARLGTRIIAGDISNGMMGILRERAKQNGVSLENVTLCRMNALDIPLEDCSVDCVFVCSVLHLISDPQKVLDGIYRVLKPGGHFITDGSLPGYDPVSAAEYEKENEEFLEIENRIYASYWAELNSMGITANKYSWRFDKEAACRTMFGSCETVRIENGKPYCSLLSDYFLPRFKARGFSDQVDVPQGIHEAVYEKVMAEYRSKYGEKLDTLGFHGVGDDIILICCVK